MKQLQRLTITTLSTCFALQSSVTKSETTNLVPEEIYTAP